MALSSVKVLVAEDNETVRKYIHILGKHSGKFSVAVEAFDGAQAVRLTLKAQPDLVLMDIAMPQLDGIEAVRQLRQQGCDTPVLMFSAHDDSDTMAEAMEAGADGFLVKTTAPNDVAQAIEQIAQLRTKKNAAH